MATNHGNVSRRGFITAMLGVPIIGALATTGVALGQYVYPPASLTKPAEPKTIAKVGQLKKGQGLKFDFDDIPGLLVKVGDGDTEKDYAAYTMKCTHLGCTVVINDPKDMSKGLFCPCHGGQYDAEGKNTGGPPPKPLPRYTMEIKGGELVITGIKKEA